MYKVCIQECLEVSGVPKECSLALNVSTFCVAYTHMVYVVVSAVVDMSLFYLLFCHKNTHTLSHTPQK